VDIFNSDGSTPAEALQLSSIMGDGEKEK